MFVYGDEMHWVGDWNAVDVLVDGGYLQHGAVINVAEGGLIVDLRCAGQRAQFVEYGRIFSCSSTARWRPDQAGQRLQVLLRRPTDGAWIWYQGESVARGELHAKHAASVQVQLPFGTVKELVPCTQLRSPLTDADRLQRRVKKNDFVIRDCLLPAGCWSEASSAVREIFQYEVNQSFHVQCTALLSQTFNYLQWHADTPLTAEQVDFEYTKTVKEDEEMDRSTLTWKWLLRQPGVVSAPQRKVSTGQRSTLPLPAELLLEVFRALDSIGRVRCRRVCPLWNALLTTDAYFPEVRVSNNAADFNGVDDYEHTLYWMTVCLLKCLNSATRMIVITGIELDEFSALTSLIRRVFRANHLPVVFYKGDFVEPDGNVDALIDCLSRLRVPKQSRGRIVWRHVLMGDEKMAAALAYHAFRAGLVGREREAAFWEVFEKNLVLTKPLDRPAVEKWIADCVAEQRKEDMEKIVEALLNYQWPDPRKPNPYWKKSWTLSNVRRLDASKLSTLTAAVLSEGII